MLSAVFKPCKFREGGEIAPKSRENGDLPSCTSPLAIIIDSRAHELEGATSMH